MRKKRPGEERKLNAKQKNITTKGNSFSSFHKISKWLSTPSRVVCTETFSFFLRLQILLPLLLFVGIATRPILEITSSVFDSLLSWFRNFSQITSRRKENVAIHLLHSTVNRSYSSLRGNHKSSLRMFSCSVSFVQLRCVERTRDSSMRIRWIQFGPGSSWRACRLGSSRSSLMWTDDRSLTRLCDVSVTVGRVNWVKSSENFKIATHDFWLERWLNLAIFNLFPVDAAEKAVIPNVFFSISPAAQAFHWVFSQKLQKRTRNCKAKLSANFSIACSPLCKHLLLLCSSSSDMKHYGPWWRRRVPPHPRHQTAAVRPAFRKAKRRKPTNQPISHKAGTEWSNGRNGK